MNTQQAHTHISSGSRCARMWVLVGGSHRKLPVRQPATSYTGCGVRKPTDSTDLAQLQLTASVAKETQCHSLERPAHLILALQAEDNGDTVTFMFESKNQVGCPTLRLQAC